MTIRLVTTVAACCLFAMSDGASAYAYQSEVQTVDNNGSVGLYPSIALDAAGNPCISYANTSYTQLRLARWTGSSWTTSCIATGTETGAYSSIAVDSSGGIHVSYASGPSHQLAYAYWDGVAWQTSIVDSTSGSGLQTSLALDASGRPCITSSDTVRLWYYTRSDTGWTAQLVDRGVYGQLGFGNCLRLDSAGHPHVTYLDDANGSLKYAFYDGASWQTQTVDLAFTWYEDTSFVLDSSGNPHIAYFGRFSEYNTYGIRYAVRRGSSWSFQDIGVYGNQASLALDAGGNPCIACSTPWRGKLAFARWNGSSWVSQIVDGSTSIVTRTALVIDGDRAHIAYWAQADQSLRYACVVVPEPSSLLAIVAGLGGLAWHRRRMG